jgi:mono/diheme cytochrome c family protein
MDYPFSSKLMTWFSAVALYACAGLMLLLAVSPVRAADQNVEETYAHKCAVCHGKDGSGQTTMGKKNNVKDFKTSDLQKKSDEELFNVIAKGTKGMTGFSKSLGDEQCHALVSYVRQLAKK